MLTLSEKKLSDIPLVDCSTQPSIASKSVLKTVLEQVLAKTAQTYWSTKDTKITKKEPDKGALSMLGLCLITIFTSVSIKLIFKSDTLTTQKFDVGFFRAFRDFRG